MCDEIMDQEKIGNVIRNIRKENNLTQTAFADRLGVSPQAVSKWENGKNLPDISTLKEIKKEFKVNIDDIIDGYSINEKYKKKETKNKIIFIALGVIIILLIVFILFHFKNMNKKNNEFEFNEVSSTNTDFKVSGNVVKTDDRTSLIINNVIYTGNDENIIYQELNCNLYEDTDGKKIKITSCDNGENSTLTNYLKTLKIRMNHYTENCKMFTESNMYIEINAINNNKTITYKIPIEINNDSCY